MYFYRAFVLCFAVMAFLFSDTSHAHSDHEANALWEMSPHELAQLNAKIEKQIQLFQEELRLALLEETSLPSAQRNFSFGTTEENAVQIPRSLPTRVLMAAVDLEILDTEKALFCGRQCSHHKKALFTQHLSWFQRHWPVLKNAFRSAVHDFTHAFQSRYQNRNSYLRYLHSEAIYKANSYGTPSMIAGAIASGVTFATTEIVETLVLSSLGGVGAVLHFACKANYFWSIAIGTAIASFSRDVKASFAFGARDGGWSRGIRGLAQAFRSQRELKSVKSGIVSQALKKVRTYSQAISETPESILQSPSFRSLALEDDILWGEILGIKNRPRETVSRSSFTSEFEKMLASSQALYEWQDSISTLKVLLKSTRLHQESMRIKDDTLVGAMKTLGQIDLTLHKFEIFVNLWLQKPVSHDQIAISAAWLSDVYSEMLALILFTHRKGIYEGHRTAIELRLRTLTEVIEASNREAAPISRFVDGEKTLLRVLAMNPLRTCARMF